jgi:hypothetical protein
MFLLWNEIKTKAIAFINDWKDTASYTGEEEETQTFENAFFDILGIDRKSGTVFEKNPEFKEDGHSRQAGLFRNASEGNNTFGPSGCIGPFWRGHILIETERLAGIKAVEYMNRADIETAYISANSIYQDKERRIYDGK